MGRSFEINEVGAEVDRAMDLVWRWGETLLDPIGVGHGFGTGGGIILLDPRVSDYELVWSASWT